MKQAPNILVIMHDQLTPSALGCYGNPATRAPHIDRLARTGVLFDAAYTNSPLCTPARYCLMTGQLPSATRGYDNASCLASTIPTFAHHARAAGYRTALAGKMHFVGPDQLHGFEERRTTDIYPADFGWTPDWRKPDERVNLATDPAHAGIVASFRAEVQQRWDMRRFHDEVLRDQARRRLIDGALRKGAYTPWDHTPKRDGTLSTLLGLLLASVCAFLPAGRAVSAEAASAATTTRVVAEGVWLIASGTRENRQPDGNTIVFDAPRGLLVIDTGRHAWHRDAIVALARERREDVVAIVNTHWHLDHVSGNPALRQAYPKVRVYASDAIDDALTGFLARSARESAEYLKDESIPAPMREDIAADAATVANGAALRPDVVIDRTGPQELGGRTLEIHLARDAVTAGDVWIYDPRSKVAVLGDLVTLPAPYLDTACPQGWLDALQDVEGTDFQTAIPGHGAPMSRAQIAQYRGALAAFIECAASNEPKAKCSAGWVEAAAPLLSGEADESAHAQSLTNYYVDMLRANGGRSEYCKAQTDTVAH